MSPAKRSDAGGQHALSPAGREACSLAATRHGVYGLMEGGLLPRCSNCPEAVAGRCPRRLPADDPQGCPLLGEFRANVLADLAQHGEANNGHLRASDWPLVVEYAKQLTLLMRIDMVLEAEGTERLVLRMTAKKPEKVGESWEVKGAGLDVHPLLALRETVSGKVFAYAEQLGLSPMGRKKLEILGKPESKPVTLAAIAAEKKEVPHA